MPRPKKAFRVELLATIPEIVPASPGDALAQLLIFDARMLDRQTQHELLRIIPELVHVRRAWKAHFLEYGCLQCRHGRRLDPTRQIAANLRQAGMPWAKVFKALAIDGELTPKDRRLICSAVCAILRRRRAGIKHSRPGVSEAQPTWYGSGGLCQGCQQIILQRMLKRFRRVTEGRDFQAETAALIEALQLKYTAAQRLLNGE